MKKIALHLSIMAALILFAVSLTAAPPTREAIEKYKAEGVWKQKVENWITFKNAGGSSPEIHPPLSADSKTRYLATGERSVDTVRLITVLMECSDNPYTNGFVGTPERFDSILYSDHNVDPIFNPTGSMTDFYFENSYGTFYITGDIYGWYEAEHPYSYYVGDDDGLSRGSELAREAAILAKTIGGADYSNYDSNNDGYCDGLIIIHAGAGAETGAYGIWSHKSSFWPELVYDGVTVSVYNMNPEENGSGLSPIGVFCHEYGHSLGLPDLYDIDYEPSSSDGLGDWTLMASGSYNGNARSPAHFDAWCKIQVGFIDPVIITENSIQTEFAAVEYNPVAYILRNDVAGDNEYWIVENRQKVGFDAALPYPGLCIYHIDENGAWSNINHLQYLVAMEQADGNEDLAFTTSNNGDAGDPWPGWENNRNFHDQSIPNSKANEYGLTPLAMTEIGVWNISNSDSLMYADLDIEFSRPYIVLSGPDSLIVDDDLGDGDGILEAGETIRLFCTVENLMRQAHNATVTISTYSPSVILDQPTADLATIFGAGQHSNSLPITFTLSPDLEPIIDSFAITIECDSLTGVAGSETYSKTFEFELHLGNPQVLIVDADRGAEHQQAYIDIVYDKRMPYAIWDRATQGLPGTSEMATYPMVFWLTGDSSTNVIDYDDIQAMKNYLNSGGNLLLTSISGVTDMNTIEPSFMSDYLGIIPGISLLWPRFTGVTDNPVGDGTQYVYLSGAPSDKLQLVEPTGSGESAFTLYGRSEVVGVTNSSATFKTVFLSFPIEYLSDVFTGFDSRETLINRIMEFFGTTSSEPCCVGTRGNIDGDPGDSMDISDIVYLATYMFQGGPPSPCFEETDFNEDGNLDISDLVFMVEYMFNGGPPLPLCP